MKGYIVGGVMVAMMASASGAHARPRHEGFTGDLGIGASLMLVPHRTFDECFSSTPDGCDGADTGSRTETQVKLGLAPLSLSLGGFINPRFALLFRAAGTSYFVDGDQVGHNFYGAVMEWWPVERIYLGGGVGFALFGSNPLLNRDGPDLEGGWALDLRVGAALAGGTNHDFTVSLEAIPGFYEDDVVTGFALVGAWKWY